MSLPVPAERIRIHGTYSNGDFGSHWTVRQVLTITECSNHGHTVTYKVLVGPHRRRQFTCPFSEFARWARYEVVRNENSWERLA